MLGCTPPDPYQAPVEEALPLACQPHLLHPAARREQMFGTVHEHTDSDKGTPLVSSMALSREDSETVFSAARIFNEAGVGQEGIPMEVNGKRGLAWQCRVLKCVYSPDRNTQFYMEHFVTCKLNFKESLLFFQFTYYVSNQAENQSCLMKHV